MNSTINERMEDLFVLKMDIIEQTIRESKRGGAIEYHCQLTIEPSSKKGVAHRARAINSDNVI